MPSDEELMTLVVKQDSQLAFEQLIQRYRLSAINYVNKIIQDNYYAQDIAQEVFAEIYFKRKAILIKRSFEAYLFRSLRNKAIDWLRVHNREKFLDIEDTVIPVAAITGKHLELGDIKRKISATDYDLMILHWIYGYSYKEIAEILPLSPGNVRIHIFRLRMKLRGEKDE